MSDIDVALRRIEIRAAWLAAAGAAAAWLIPGGGPWLGAAVLGGGFLALWSYWSIRRSVGGLADAVLARGSAMGAGRGVASMLIRYALLAGMAYVMIARLRLPPVGLLGGASVVPAAAAFEFFRRRS